MLRVGGSSPPYCVFRSKLSALPTTSACGPGARGTKKGWPSVIPGGATTCKQRPLRCHQCGLSLTTIFSPGSRPAGHLRVMYCGAAGSAFAKRMPREKAVAARSRAAAGALVTKLMRFAEMCKRGSSVVGSRGIVSGNVSVCWAEIQAAMSAAVRSPS